MSVQRRFVKMLSERFPFPVRDSGAQNCRAHVKALGEMYMDKMRWEQKSCCEVARNARSPLIGGRPYCSMLVKRHSDVKSWPAGKITIASGSRPAGPCSCRSFKTHATPCAQGYVMLLSLQSTAALNHCANTAQHAVHRVSPMS
jgi:hypothetical protein